MRSDPGRCEVFAPGVEFHKESGTLFLTPAVIRDCSGVYPESTNDVEAILWAFRSFMRTAEACGIRTVVIVPSKG